MPSINKYWDAAIVASTMFLMFIALIFWACVQRQIFRELGGTPPHVLAAATWGVLFLATFALSLLRSANEVTQNPWFFRVYLVLALLVITCYPAVCVVLEGHCNTIENNFLDKWKNNTLPKKASQYITLSFCEEHCEDIITVFVRTFCTVWARRMLYCWGFIFSLAIAGGTIYGIVMWQRHRRPKTD